MTNYTVGFIFDKNLQHVLLINKLKPAWQKGKLNGVGGKLEEGETPKEGVLREVLEETGIQTKATQLMEVGELIEAQAKIYIFTTIIDKDIHKEKSLTQEKVAWHQIDALPQNIIPNLLWQIPFCLNILTKKDTGYFLVKYD